MAIPYVDDSNADLYTAGGSGQAVIHALYLTNKSNANNGFVDVKVKIGRAHV